MTQVINDTEPDLSHIHWSYPEWIHANAGGSLANPDLAMDYFALSPFFDLRSNNSVLFTQRRIQDPTYGYAQAKHELNAFRAGFEYILAHTPSTPIASTSKTPVSSGPFVIHRREVLQDGTRSSISGAWFILDERIYPTPTLYDVIATRLRNATHLVAKTFTTLSSAHPPANPRAQQQWRSLPPSQQTQIKPNTTITTASTPPPETDEGTDTPTTKPEKENSKPDWNLYHALLSSRAALSNLDYMASSPTPEEDGMGELKRIEAEIFGETGGGSVRGGGSVVPRGHNMKEVSSIGSPLVRLGGLGGSVRGRAESIAMSGVGAPSPLASVMSPSGR